MTGLIAPPRRPTSVRRNEEVRVSLPLPDGSATHSGGSFRSDRPAPDRNLALELVRVTEAGAMAAGRWVGRGGKKGGDGNGPECDVAVDPVDGTTLMAKGMPNAIAVMAVADRGAIYDPSAVFYMEKIAV